MLALWRDDRRQRRALSRVVLIVFYHGKRRWRQKPLAETFEEGPIEWDSFLPDIQYLLIDLNAIKEEVILQHRKAPDLCTFLIILKFAHDLEELGKRLPLLVSLSWSREAQKEQGSVVLRQAVVHYINELLAMNKISVSAWKERFSDEGHEAWIRMVEEYLSTIPEGLLLDAMGDLSKELLEQGRQEGREKTLQTIIANTLRQMPDWSDEKIAQILGAEALLVAQIRQQIDGGKPESNQ